jgi:hypothetical protein
MPVERAGIRLLPTLVVIVLCINPTKQHLMQIALYAINPRMVHLANTKNRARKLKRPTDYIINVDLSRTFIKCGTILPEIIEGFQNTCFFGEREQMCLHYRACFVLLLSTSRYGYCISNR